MGASMWFGPMGYETWVKAPRIDMDSSHVHVGSQADQVNGGASIRNSGAGRQEYGISWNPAPRDTTSLVQDIADGMYDTDAGRGLIHFIDPAAQDKNLLPRLWGSPMLCGANFGAPSLVKGVRPVLEATATNSKRLPAQTATFTTTTTMAPLELYIPLPPGMTAYWAFYGPTAQASKVQVIPVNGTTRGSATAVGVVANSGYGTGLTATAASATVTGMILRLNPVAGSVKLTAGLCVLSPTAKPAPTAPSMFMSGRGNSGCMIAPQSLQSVVHNVARDRSSLSLRLVERGSWL